MSTNELLEVVKIFGLITVVWFAVVGWKLIPPPRKHRSRWIPSSPTLPRASEE